VRLDSVDRLVVTHYGGQSPALGVISLVILAAILAEWPARGVGGRSRGSGRVGWRLAVFPLLWMASEHARSFVYKGFPGTSRRTRSTATRSGCRRVALGAFGVGALVMACRRRCCACGVAPA
jgi:apolipoprotein N-acyltransferase